MHMYIYIYIYIFIWISIWIYRYRLDIGIDTDVSCKVLTQSILKTSEARGTRPGLRLLAGSASEPRRSEEITRCLRDSLKGPLKEPVKEPLKDCHKGSTRDPYRCSTI